MVYVKRTPLLEIEADIIVCPVSNDGVLSYGLTKDVFYKYPDLFPKYENMCQQRKNIMFTYDTSAEQRICLFTIKNMAREHADIGCIAESLNEFIKYKMPKNTTIVFPELGYHEVDKTEVEQLVYQYLDGIPQKVYFTKNQGDRKTDTKKRKE